MPANEFSNFDMSFAGPRFDALCLELEQKSPELEQGVDWPLKQFEQMASAGVLGWIIPEEFGGADITSCQLTVGYERLAAACLVTTFVLTQRNGACQRIAGGENDALKQELLPLLCRGEKFATVGISHLTTSRQHLRKPAVAVEQSDSGFIFNGTVPWVTGANHADDIVTGGTCPDGQQVLAVIPTAVPGVRACEPVPMLALNASHTGAVELTDVEISASHVIAGPAENVMKRGKGGGTGSLATSALAVGTAEAALKRLALEAEAREDLVEIHGALERERRELSSHIVALSEGVTADDVTGLTAESVRKRANSLVLRASQAYLTAAKGAGFVSGHPAERLVREAMFFLVWSCPLPVLNATLREFACVVEP